MAIISRLTTWSDLQVLTATALNGEFNNLLNDYNGDITNANISASAAIDASKINLGISGSIVGTTDSQTLTNKILTSPTINGATITGSPTITKPTVNGVVLGTATYTPGIGGTATLDLSAATRHLITMPAGNITIALTNDTTNQPFSVEITQDSGGSRTVTWFSTIRWAGGTTPTLTTSGNKRDSFIFIKTGTGTYDGFILGQNI